jgi:hypothetical protein
MIVSAYNIADQSGEGELRDYPHRDRGLPVTYFLKTSTFETALTFITSFATRDMYHVQAALLGNSR